MIKLETIRTIRGWIRVITGLHIGASKENIEIGGLDQRIIKDPLDMSPYIPGSSLKGKMRSLIEIREGRYSKNGDPCNCGQKNCPVCPVFGTSANPDSDSIDRDLGPTRIMVRDARLTEKWQKRFDEGNLPMEEKYENTIDRIHGVAKNPRPIERVPAGVEFEFNIAFKKFKDDPASYYNTLLKAMKLLEMDALGGAGSRGSGQIKFVRVFIDGKEQAENFLDGIAIA